MNLIINPVIKKTYGGRRYRVFVKIDYSKGNLSLCGVEGPLPSGNCLGNYGQIADSLLEGIVRYMPGWDKAKVRKLQEVWNRWHLCGHQRQEVINWLFSLPASQIEPPWYKHRGGH